jgi:hypothetical protein
MILDETLDAVVRCLRSGMEVRVDASEYHKYGVISARFDGDRYCVCTNKKKEQIGSYDNPTEAARCFLSIVGDRLALQAVFEAT